MRSKNIKIGKYSLYILKLVKYDPNFVFKNYVCVGICTLSIHIYEKTRKK